jgi:glycosyltransferase involved in cell wall biosynthesis
MIVLQVVPELNAGGVEKTTLEIAEVLSNKGYDTHVVTKGGRLEKDFLRIGTKLHKTNIGSKNILSLFYRISFIRKIIKLHGIQLVHARSRAPAWPAYYAARAEGIPFLTTYHGIYNSNSWLKDQYNSIMVKGKHIIANSNFTKDHIVNKHRVSPDKITVVPRGVDTEVFDPKKVENKKIKELLSEWKVPVKNKIILLPGRLTKWKGQLIAVEALRYLPKDYTLVLMGDPQGRKKYINEIYSKVAKLNLKKQFVILNHRLDVASAIAAADIVISASTDPEAFGRVMVEAQAMQKPVVATAHGGSLQTVLNKKTGFLIPPNDPKALAVGIKKACSWSNYNGKFARSHIKTQFSTQNLKSKTLNLYKQLLK